MWAIKKKTKNRKTHHPQVGFTSYKILDTQTPSSSSVRLGGVQQPVARVSEPPCARRTNDRFPDALAIVLKKRDRRSRYDFFFFLMKNRGVCVIFHVRPHGRPTGTAAAAGVTFFSALMRFFSPPRKPAVPARVLHCAASDDHGGVPADVSYAYRRRTGADVEKR